MEQVAPQQLILSQTVFVDKGSTVVGTTGEILTGKDLKPGQRVEFGMAVGRRGPQALSVKLLEQPTLRQKGGRRESTADKKRRSPDELHGMIEDMINLLEASVQKDLRRGQYPDRKAAQRISEVLRAVARELDS